MIQDAARLAADLPLAVAHGQIIAHYQPQFDVATRDVVAAETLARWMHPELGLIGPSVFIPLAEQLGLIGELGDHMIGVACDSALDWQRSGHAIEVAVNVSATQLGDREFAHRLLSAIRDRGLDPRLLIVEVTESTEIIDVSAVAERLDWLRGVGVTISVDDFGTGHSSIEQVLDLRATELKIDQSLIRDESIAARTLLAAVVTFAHDKRLRVVAEGIETESQLARAAELHCDRAQGFLLGRPIDKATFDALLSGQSVG